MTQILNFGGQKVVYNHETKIAKTTINEPFWSAGKQLGWNKADGTVGIGINQQIISFIMKTKATLIVHVATEGKDYWLKYDALKDFIEYNQTEWTTGNTKLNVISWKRFTRYNR